MPMSSAGMSAAIKAKLDAASPMSNSQQLADALAEAIVAYIQINAVVLPTALIAPGGMSPAPVTGTGTIT